MILFFPSHAISNSSGNSCWPYFQNVTRIWLSSPLQSYSLVQVAIIFHLGIALASNRPRCFCYWPLQFILGTQSEVYFQKLSLIMIFLCLTPFTLFSIKSQHPQDGQWDPPWSDPHTCTTSPPVTPPSLMKPHWPLLAHKCKRQESTLWSLLHLLPLSRMLFSQIPLVYSLISFKPLLISSLWGPRWPPDSILKPPPPHTCTQNTALSSHHYSAMFLSSIIRIIF